MSGLDFNAAREYARQEGQGWEQPDCANYRSHLNAQVRALVEAAVAEEREKVLRKVAKELWESALHLPTIDGSAPHRESAAKFVERMLSHPHPTDR